MKRAIGKWKVWGVAPHFEERIQRKIGNKSTYGSTKQMDATTAAIINTLYSVGPDLALAPKDMVNDITRRACAFDKGLLTVQTLDKRGQESCGHDEYEGYAYDLAAAVTAPTQMNDLTSTYQWRYAGIPKLKVRFDTHDEAKEAGRLNILDLVKELMEEHMTETDWSGKGMGETTTRDERLDWMLQRWDDDQWVRLLDYRATDWNTNYKGECAWKDDKSKRCTFHNGRVNETTIVYFTDSEGKVATRSKASNRSTSGYGRNRTTSYRGVREGYSAHYLDEYEGDEVAFINSLVTDEEVISRIKKCIPKMKTESRNWLMSSRQVSKYTLKDENEPDVWANREYYTEQVGKRGHYQLTWWASFKQEDETKRAKEEEERGLKADEMRDGLEINGWKFNVGKMSTRYDKGIKSRWKPIEPVYIYEVSGYHFLTEASALQFGISIGGWRAMMVASTMDKHGAVIDLSVKKVKKNVILSKGTDPKLFTPEEVVHMRYKNKPFPTGYACSKLCTFVEEEEE